MKPAVLLPAFALLAACYGASPPHPVHVTLPALAEGAELDVHSETKTTMESVSKKAYDCPAGHNPGDQACRETTYSVVEPVSRTTSSASYGAEPVTYAQFKVMTDPRYDAKLTRLADLSQACKRANVPRYAGMGLLLGGVITGALVGGVTGQRIMWGGAGLGIGSYALGYFAFGGRACNEARAIYNDVDVSAALSWNTVEGADYATEMKSLAEQFNATHVHQTAAQLQMRRAR